MRLKSELWVRAYIRGCASADCPAFIVRHGDNDAGATYIKINHLDGTASLYGPAPMSLDGPSEGHRFASIFGGGGEHETRVDDYMRQQLEFDGDLWLVEVEDAKKRHFLDGWLVQA